jgi:hypothetical protein
LIYDVSHEYGIRVLERRLESVEGSEEEDVRVAEGDAVFFTQDEYIKKLECEDMSAAEALAIWPRFEMGFGPFVGHAPFNDG